LQLTVASCCTEATGYRICVSGGEGATQDGEGATQKETRNSQSGGRSEGVIEYHYILTSVE
jgi:hypothetical protein